MKNWHWLIFSGLLIFAISCRNECGDNQSPDFVPLYIYDSTGMAPFPYDEIRVRGYDKVFYNTNGLYLNPGASKTTFYLSGPGINDTITLRYEIEIEEEERCDTYSLINLEAIQPTSFDSLNVSDFYVQVFN